MNLKTIIVLIEFTAAIINFYLLFIHSVLYEIFNVSGHSITLCVYFNGLTM